MSESAGQRLREALQAPGVLMLPGAYDAITARVIASKGFEALYITGAGVTNAQLGLPDVGLVTLTEMTQAVSRIVGAVPIPALVDADTGYGHVANVQRAVKELERAGVGGLHLEDQEIDKRCGHLDGKRLVSVDEMAEKVSAAAAARDEGGLVIVARTDAAAIEGVEGALTRAHAYVAAGAEAIFVEALTNKEEFERFASEAPKVPLIANMTEFGRTPLTPASEFERMGYAAVLFPMTAFRLMLKAVDDGLAELARTGTQYELIERMATRAELYELLDYVPGAAPAKGPRP